MLTRSQMEQVIKDGGSVLHGGRIITRMEHLPTDADLAVGNPEQEAAVAAALEAQIAALQARHDRLMQSRTVRTGAVPAPAPEPTAEPTGTAQEAKEPPAASGGSGTRRDEPTKRGR
jgi:hypothetical protein